MVDLNLPNLLGKYSSNEISFDELVLAAKNLSWAKPVYDDDGIGYANDNNMTVIDEAVSDNVLTETERDRIIEEALNISK